MTFERFVGLLVVAAVSVGVLTIGVALLGRSIMYFLDLRYEDAKRAAILEMSGRLFQDGYWFSEDEATYKLIQSIATSLVTHGWADPAAEREKWRRIRAEAGQPK